MFGLFRAPARAATVATAAFALGLTAHGSTALAGGLEIPDNGTVAMGRAGAFSARASDPTALIHNTAGIVGLEGVQITLGSNFGLLSHCFQRSGNYDSMDSANITLDGTVFQNSHYADPGAHVPYPQVCNNPAPAITPHLLATFRLNRYVAVGIGFYAPNTTGSNQFFPETVMTSAGLAPSPARYLIFEKSLLAGYITLAAAFAPTPWLRFGLALQPSFAAFHLGTMLNVSPISAQSPDQDLHLALDTSGAFLAGNIAVQILPSPYIGLGAQLHLNPDAHLHGTGTITANPYAANMAQQQTSSFAIDRMTVPLPSSLRAGVRFVLPRVGRPHQADRFYDPMRDDVFDIEFGFMYETTSSLSTNTLQNSGTISLMGVTLPAPTPVTVLSDLRNTFGFRLGSDVNIVPGMFALRAGVAYETGAQNPALAQIHLPSFDTLSVHGGLSFRYRWFGVNLAYGHYFMFPLDASSGNRSPIVAMGIPQDPMAAQAAWAQQCMGPNAGPGACHVNQGTFQATYNVLSLGFNFMF